MIVDTSALIAIAYGEPQFENLLDALLTGNALVPAPVLVEFDRVLLRQSALVQEKGRALIARLLSQGLRVATFGPEAAFQAVAANSVHGKGNGSGGALNMLDLMVYGMARALAMPILCTGNDFRATDAAIHPASRIG